MGNGVERRFERYAESMVQVLGHADRADPARWYLRGLMLTGTRQSALGASVDASPGGRLRVER